MIIPEYEHGGDIYRNEVKIDFSVNLNPLGVPSEIRHAVKEGSEQINKYPDPFCIDLRQAIAECENTGINNVICGNGASELITAAVHTVRPEKALVVSPCYSGYRTALKAVGARTEEYILSESNDFRLGEDFPGCVTEDIDMVFLTDPNNPNGSLIDGEILDAIIDKCAECNCVLLLDECFKPLTCADRKNRSGKGTVLHLRAFTKTFAIPGIRLGYMISGDTDILEEIRIHLPEWNISQIADKAGKAACDMLMHTDFLAESADLISMERSYLKKELTDLGLKVYPSDVNYLLIRYKSGLYEKLLKYGILIRRCENFRGLDDTYFRIAVRKHEENEVLVDTLRNIINTGE